MRFDKRFGPTALILVVLLPFYFGCTHNATFEKRGCFPTVCFTPGGDCTSIIVGEIEKAKKRILVQAYSFTSVPIADALVDAFHRGVKVEVILDKSQKGQRASMIDLLVDTGIPTYIDTQHSIAHNKIMVIDRTTVITGSFNFTKAAQEKNAENLIFLHAPALISRYTKNWMGHREHSQQIAVSGRL
ncbi:MAG: phospholipase D family protein [Deltaproteobacteria bacterium]|nr:phospholipase D family protein [Deltaproteobacteria bacterium]